MPAEDQVIEVDALSHAPDLSGQVSQPQRHAAEAPHPQAAEVTAAQLAAIAEQLGRVPRGVVAVAASCQCGAPLVATTAPRLPDGTPFPTLYYLTHPGISQAVSKLEADGLMRDFNERLAADAEFAAQYATAHQAYISDRSAVAQQLELEVPEILGISAGGMPTRVKCLHALVAHSLAAGPGVNPVGDEVLALINYNPSTCLC